MLFKQLHSWNIFAKRENKIVLECEDKCIESIAHKQRRLNFSTQHRRSSETDTNAVEESPYIDS